MSNDLDIEMRLTAIELALQQVIPAPNAVRPGFIAALKKELDGWKSNTVQSGFPEERAAQTHALGMSLIRNGT